MADFTISSSHGKDILVCIFQRGAADGLNSVVPYADGDYYSKRPNIAVPAPGQQDGAIDLDGFFGLHPALTPLKSIYDSGDLALVQATGVPHGSRSHFSAQGLVERGVTDKSGPSSGWLGRHLALSADPGTSAFRIVSISGNVPVVLTGASEPIAITDIASFGFDPGIIDAGYPDILSELYRSPIPFTDAATAALSAVQELAAARPGDIAPDNGAVYPTGPLGNKLKQAAQLIKSTLPVEVICIDSDGWDHHENLPGFIQTSLTELAGSLSAFHTDMGGAIQNITVFVHTEFGRRVAQNASVGVDHGTGSLAYVMGGQVQGGQVFAQWPGLRDQDLELGEDLAITTDLRNIAAEILMARLGGSDISAVFPGLTYQPAGLFV